jgi:regulator of protease activity HflC (stomatin/prohibitin superfamily)
VLNLFKRIWFWVDDNIVKASITIIVAAILIVVMWPMTVIYIPAGHLGVHWSRFFGGTDTEHVYQEGTRVIFPWDTMTIYDARFQLIERTFDVMTSDNLSTKVNIAFRFRIDEKNVGILHKLVGPDYLNVLLVADVGSQARAVFAHYRPEEAFTEKRTEVENAILHAVDKNLLENFNPSNMQSVKFLELEDILVRDVQFPVAVAQSIERKSQEYNRAQQYDFSIIAEQKEAQRKQIEAQGIRTFQDIVKDGLTDNYLRWRGIEATLALAQSQNSKVVVIGSGPTGLPIILGNDSTPSTNPAPGASSAAPSSLPLTPGALRPTPSITRAPGQSKAVPPVQHQNQSMISPDSGALLGVGQTQAIEETLQGTENRPTTFTTAKPAAKPAVEPEAPKPEPAEPTPPAGR